MRAERPWQELATWHCRVRTVPLDPGPSADRLVRAFGDEPGFACLDGRWADGALLFRGPLITVTDRAGALAAIGVQPQLDYADVDDPGRADHVVGGGWVGWLGYGPAAQLSFYDSCLRCRRDRHWSFECLWSPDRADALDASLTFWQAALAAVPGDAGPAHDDWQVGDFVPGLDTGCARDRHLAAVEAAVGHIRAGDIYQVNVCTRLYAPFHGSAAAAFVALRQTLRPDYAALLTGPDTTLMSTSPELFLRRHAATVTSRPIKGTVARAPGDDGGAARLAASTKDAAENVMITDLIRNDLGTVCELGTVTVPDLLRVEPHPGVWHLVSTVRGRVADDVTDAGLLAATFPPGSVTGAPKLAAIATIDEVEDSPRGAYTGSLGIASPVSGLTHSVAIRTFELHDTVIELGVGGGITVDSVPMLEWRECLHKAVPLIEAIGSGLGSKLSPGEDAHPAHLVASGVFETMLAVHGEVLRLGDHLARLDRSCRELYSQGLPDDVAARVGAHVGTGRLAVRLYVRPTPTGLDVQVSSTPAPTTPAPTAVVVRGRRGSWRHKWADRTTLVADEQATAPASPLYVAGDGTVLETSRGNVFALMSDGALVTAPLRDDLLPGVTRRAVLDRAADLGLPARVAPFTLADLRTARAAFTSGSLRGLVPITSIDGVAVPECAEPRARLHAMLGFDRP